MINQKNIYIKAKNWILINSLSRQQKLCQENNELDYIFPSKFLDDFSYQKVVYYVNIRNLLYFKYKLR